MTSSLELQKRIQDPNWQLPHGVHWSDVYIRPFNNCHPDYVTVPIGNKPGGVKMCIRKRNADGSDPKHFSLQRNKEYFEKVNHSKSFIESDIVNGYHKYQSRLYSHDPKTSHEPIRTLSHGVCMRRPPYEEENIRRDLIKQEIRYNGTGINPMTTPSGKNDEGRKMYVEYSAQILKQAPKKFDVTRLEQPFPLYQQYHK